MKKRSDTIIIQGLANLLYDFVKRATSKDATPEEIAVLPEVAQVLANLLIIAS